MTEIRFTQFLRPDARRSTITINRPQDIADKAHWIQAHGFELTAEVVPLGQVCFTISDPGQEEDLAVVLCPNGAEVPVAVDKMICDFYAREKGND